MTLRNLTPHPVRLELPSGRPLVLPAAARPARVVAPVPARVVLRLGGEPVPVLLEPPGPALVALPDPRPGVALVVSRAVAERARHRPDLLVPATGPGEGAVRDALGHVVAVTALKRLLPAPERTPRSAPRPT